MLIDRRSDDVHAWIIISGSMCHSMCDSMTELSAESAGDLGKHFHVVRSRNNSSSDEFPPPLAFFFNCEQQEV